MSTTPHHGFVWTARAAGLIAGGDRYLEGAGAMEWKLAGLVTVAAGGGPDVSRSAAGRAGAEGVWLPTALLPRFGVRWSAQADDEVTAAFEVGETPVELHLRLDGVGRVTSLAFDRWGDPDGDGFRTAPVRGRDHRPRQLRRPDHPQRRPARLASGRGPLHRRRVLPLPDHRASAGGAGGAGAGSR